MLDSTSNDSCNSGMIHHYTKALREAEADLWSASASLCNRLQQEGAARLGRGFCQGLVSQAPLDTVSSCLHSECCEAEFDWPVPVKTVA